MPAMRESIYFVAGLAATVVVASVQALVQMVQMPTVWRWALRIAAFVFGLCTSWLLADFLAEEGLGMWIGLNHSWWSRGLFGAIGGAVIWLAITSFHGDVRAQGNSAMTSRENLASALEKFATAVANAPPVIIGSRTSVSVNGPTSGTIIGKQVGVTVNGPMSGTVIGESTSVTAGGSNPTPPMNAPTAARLREGAAAVRNGGATRAGVQELLSNSELPASVSPAELDAALAAANSALAASDLK